MGSKWQQADGIRIIILSCFFLLLNKNGASSLKIFMERGGRGPKNFQKSANLEASTLQLADYIMPYDSRLGVVAEDCNLGGTFCQPNFIPGCRVAESIN
jgi:hypothetical protein